MLYFPRNYGIANHTDTMRIRDHHRPVEKARVLHPCCAGHLAVAIFSKPGGENRIFGFFSARQNGGNSGSNGPFAHFQDAVPGNQSGMSDLNALYICDGINRSGSAVKRNFQIACARLGLWRSENCKKHNGNPRSQVKFQHQSPPE